MEEDLKKKQIIKILNIISWLSFLWWPIAFILAFAIGSESSNIDTWLFLIFLFLPVISFICALFNGVIKITLLLPLALNVFIIFLGFIQLEMGGAQVAAKDARIKSAIYQFSLTAETVKSNNHNSYGKTFINYDKGVKSCVSGNNSLITTNSDGLALCNDIQRYDGSLFIYSTDDKYCIQKTLPSGQVWCLDNIKGAGGSGCDSINFDCR